ncbi:DUF58 domain-containing protein [Anaeromicropila herbilytica]|uniref:DUF58 domain-containing protein n=1 Tax=Anaeromicropila herbilytica TaxID=2785025 RepID=A0A7R7IES9_9FIRM|nr:DUF58 domain-containing protein [Anaeromicropila herbilytica]BCN32434.1 hypothetical protein bsdtb5_37290 [Anaeromicropila herbilytica]
MELIIGIIGIFLLYQIQKRIYRQYWDKKLEVNVELDHQPIMEGKETTITETISNSKKLALPFLRIAYVLYCNHEIIEETSNKYERNYYRDFWVSVSINQKVTRKIRFLPKKRGFYRLKTIYLESPNIFLTEKRSKEVIAKSSLYVYPANVPIDKIKLPFDVLMQQYRTNQFSLEDSDFRGIREYSAFDPMKYVNWKASARSNELYVNVHEFSAKSEIYILLNLTENIEEFEQIFEESIRIACSMAVNLLQKEVPVGLISNGVDCMTEKEIMITAATGKRQMTLIKESLSRCVALRSLSDFSNLLNKCYSGKKSNQLFLIISSEHSKEIMGSYQKISKVASNTLWIIPLYKEMDMNGLSNSSYVKRWEVNRNGKTGELS